MPLKRSLLLGAKVVSQARPELVINLRVPIRGLHASAPRATYTPGLAKNRIFTSICNEEEFLSLLLLSATNRVPLITLWTASWCPSCRVVLPVLKELIERDGVGANHGGVGFAEVEVDSPTIGDLPSRYIVNSIPMLLSFSRQEPQMETRVTSVNDLKNRAFLTQWIETEAKRGGAGGAGGSLLGFFKNQGN